MKSVLRICMVCLICLSSFAVLASANGAVVINPATIELTLEKGGTQNAQIAVALPEGVPKGDVVFVFDTTGWLSNFLYAMKVQGITVMNQIRDTITDSQFGAGSFMDYPHPYTNYYGYSPTGGLYGCCGDYAWKKDIDLTDDINAVSAAIQGIPIGNGADFPQDYTRVIYESQFYSWRDDARKIYVIFGDAPPHAAPSGSSIFNDDFSPWGGDPGRDEIPYTADDLDYVPVVEEIAGLNINIVGVYLPYGGISDPVGNDAEVNFRYMADKTGGLYFVTNPDADPNTLSNEIVTMIKAMAKKPVRELSLEVQEPDLAGWVTISPDTPHSNVPWPSTREFGIIITPVTANPGETYTLHINVVGDGVVFGTVPVTVHVKENKVIEPLPVAVDIKPGSCPNSFNAKEKGVLPAAILGSRDLKVTDIDPESIVLTREGLDGEVKPLRSSIEDVASPSDKTCSCGMQSGKEDRNKDLTLKFDSEEMVKTLGITKDEECIMVTISGILRSSDPAVDGRPFTGTDSLRVLNKGQGSCDGKDGEDGKGSCDGKDGKDDTGSCDGKDGKKGDSPDKGGADQDKGKSDGGDHRDGKDGKSPDDGGNGKNKDKQDSGDSRDGKDSSGNKGGH